MPIKDYNELLLEELQDIEEAAEYLTACFEDSEEVFLQGLRKVVEAHGGIGALAKDSSLNRENLYRMLSGKGNPRLSSLSVILQGLGLQLQFSPRGDEEKAT